MLHQRNLLVGEGPNLLTVDDNGANQHILSEHRQSNKRPRAAEPCGGARRRRCRVIGSMDHVFWSFSPLQVHRTVQWILGG